MHVPQPGRRHRCHLCRGVPSLQRCPLQPHRCLLLVGLGTHLWSDRDLFGRSHPPVVSPRRVDAGPSRHLGADVRRPQHLWTQVGRSCGHPHRHAGCSVGAGVEPDSDLRRHCRLAPGGRLAPDLPVPGTVRQPHQRHGRSLPGRIRRPGLRGGGLPYRGDEEPQPRPALGHVGQRWGGQHLLRDHAHRVAGRARHHHTRPVTPNRLGNCAGPDLRPRLRCPGQVDGYLVHHDQHVQRHHPTAVGSIADPVTVVRGRPAASIHRLPPSEDRCTSCRHPLHCGVRHRLPAL